MMTNDMTQIPFSPKRTGPSPGSAATQPPRAHAPSRDETDTCAKCGAALGRAAATLAAPTRSQSLLYNEVTHVGNDRAYTGSGWVLPLCASCATMFGRWICQRPDQ